MQGFFFIPLRIADIPIIEFRLFILASMQNHLIGESKMKSITSLSLAMVFSMSAHASLIADKSGINEKDYIYDMHQCETLAGQVQKETRSRGAVGGALKGAAVGAAGSAIAGGSGTQGAKTGAAVGGTAGVIGGSRDRRANQTAYKQEQHVVMRNCMTNRGYTVLN
tara:strand:+ start:715 stop:1212 length:498 start_codon:yes stop_codon:yes gene_type:complete